MKLLLNGKFKFFDSNEIILKILLIFKSKYDKNKKNISLLSMLRNIYNIILIMLLLYRIDL